MRKHIHSTEYFFSSRDKAFYEDETNKPGSHYKEARKCNGDCLKEEISTTFLS